MSAQKGKDLLLKVRLTQSDPYTTVAGMRSRRISFNADTVDITDFESAGRWRHLLSGAGVQRASVSGSGIFKDAESDEMLRDMFFTNTHGEWQLVVPDFGTLEGRFQISALEYGAPHDGEVTFEMSLESAGPISFAVAA